MTATLKSVYASLPHTERARSLVLNGDPKGKNFLYCNGKHVIIRDINNPGIAETYSQHSVQTTVAQYSPSGYYIASGDVSGKIRIWDTVNAEHILKYEAQPFAGPVRDLCWDSESKRIVVGGQGKETFGSVFMWDSGSRLGEITGHSKQINSVSFKQTRPFRVVTASEDHNSCFFEGPPFKLKAIQKEHKNFVNCVRYSPSGAHFCTVSSDKNAYVYDGKTAELAGKLGGEFSHNGGIYGVCWSPDGSQLLTASADKTCKLWDVETRQEISVFNMGTTVADQQLGCIWQGDNILSCSLSGSINYLDRNNPDKPIRVIQGQNKNLNSITASVDGSHIFCGSYDGRVSYWDTASGAVGLVSGNGHSNLVCSMVATQDNLYSLGLDKSLRTSSTTTFEFQSDSVSFPDRDPRSLAVSRDGLLVVGTHSDISLVRDGKVVQSVSAPSGEPFSAAFNPTRPELAVGTKDSTIVIYSVENDTLKETRVVNTDGEVNAIEYDSKGELLAIGGSKKAVVVYNTTDYQCIGEFMKHTARISGLSFSADSRYIVSSGYDTNVCVHDLEKKESKLIRGAHPLSIVNGISWVNDDTFATCGEDCCIRVWQFTR